MSFAYILLTRLIHPIPLQLIQFMIDSPLYSNYTFYVIIDDNSQNISDFIINYPKIKFLQINDDLCKEKGYINMTYSITKTPVSWDKCIYYFSEIEPNKYDFYWFIEDDVFIPSKECIYNIDKKYIDNTYHLLSRENSVNLYNKNVIAHKWPLWHLAQGKIPLPWFKSLCCAIRISNTLLQIIKKYASIHKSLFFLELMFPSLCSHNKLKNKIIPELYPVHFRHNWNYNDIYKNMIYHPIKDYNVQKTFYKQINNIDF